MLIDKLRFHADFLGSSAFWMRLFNSRGGIVLFPLALGALASCGFAPLEKWPLTLAGLSLIFYLTSVYKSKKAVFCGLLCFFTALNAITLWWLNFVMEGFGGLPVLLSNAVVILFALYLGLPYALLGTLGAALCRGRMPVLLLCFIPAGFTAADFIISWLFSGFPWTFVGYTAQEGPLSAYAPLVGVRGINLLFYITAGAIALNLKRQFVFLPIAGVIFIAGVFCEALTFTTEEEEPLQVSLVQGNIAQSIKWTPEMVAPIIGTYWNLSEPLFKPGQLVIWPESALPLYFERAVGLLADLNYVAYSRQSLLITGLQHIDEEKYEAFNSLLIVGGQEKISSNINDLNHYDKRKLVPFGEIVPFEDQLRPLGSIFNFPMSSFTRGADGQANIEAFGHKLIPAICYEAIFPELIRELNQPESGAIVMLSNDSWFGPTYGPQQHLNIARMRCLELQKPMLRATNSGVTAFISREGWVIRALPSDEAGVLQGSVTCAQGMTPYARVGSIPVIILALLLAAAGFYYRRQDPDKRRQVLESLIRP